jgi:hypothetical protein
MPERFAPLAPAPAEEPAPVAAAASAVVHDDSLGDAEDDETPPSAPGAAPPAGAPQIPGGSSVYLSDKELLEAQSATDDGEVEE